MPAGVHNSNVKLLGFWADAEVVHRVDEARGIAPRSDYLRDALVEYLSAQGFRVPQRLRRAALEGRP